MNASLNSTISIRRGQQQNSIQILYVGIDTVSHGERESGLATRGIDLAGSFAQINSKLEGNIAKLRIHSYLCS
jgi:hypothetical protein